MARNQNDFTLDVNLQLKDAGLVAADAAAQVSSAAKVLDFGQSRVDARVIVDVSVIEVDSNDERYFIRAQFSDDDFAASIVGGTVLELGALEITDAEVDTPVGRYELPFTNEINGVTYRYMRLFTAVEGTIAGGGGINYTAWVVKAA
jgi:hypothetical protein